MGLLGLLIVLILTATPAWAANWYVRAAATGSANGSDWTNACTDFTGSCAVSSLVRGDTYYVATGAYASRTFNRAESGTLVITIKGKVWRVLGVDRSGGSEGSLSREATAEA